MSGKRSHPRQPKNRQDALDAAEFVLKKFAKRKPMHCQDIAKKAIQEGRLISKATRPGAPGQQLLYRARKDIKKREEQGASARFTNPAKGYLGLAEWERKASPARSKKTAGVIYVLSNPGMKGILKIGRAKDLKRRMTTLDTAVPDPYHCVCAVRVDNAADLEKKLHRILGGRVEGKREFYRLNASDLIPFLQGLGEDVTPAL